MFSSPSNVEDEIDTIHKILESNTFLFHLRKPNLNIQETRCFLNKISVNYHSKIVIHNHISLLNEYKLKGFYCTRQFLEKNKIELLKQQYPKSIFSKGCHSINELKDINHYNYVFLSPIFDSISKNNLHSNFKLTQLEKELKLVKTAIYALGGITPNQLKKIEHINFKGVGVLGFIWENKHPIKQLHKLFK